MAAVLIFKKAEVVSCIDCGVPIIATKLEDSENSTAASTMETSRIMVREVRIGEPGPVRLCKPFPTKKKIARTKVSCTTSSNRSMNWYWATVARAFVSGIAFPIKYMLYDR